MKKEKITTALYFVVSVCFFIAAIIGFANDSSMAIVWFCLGTAMLCFGSVSLNKAKSEIKDEDDEDDKE